MVKNRSVIVRELTLAIGHAAVILRFKELTNLVQATTEQCRNLGFGNLHEPGDLLGAAGGAGGPAVAGRCTGPNRLDAVNIGSWNGQWPVWKPQGALRVNAQSGGHAPIERAVNAALFSARKQLARTGSPVERHFGGPYRTWSGAADVLTINGSADRAATGKVR